MTKKRSLLTFLYFLLFTEAFAVFAFMTGVAHSEKAKTGDVGLFQIGTTEGLQSQSDVICGWGGKTRDAQLESFCHPFFKAGDEKEKTAKKPAGKQLFAQLRTEALRSAPSAPPAKKGGALTSAVNRALAGLPNSHSDQPIALAMAPNGGGDHNPFIFPPTSMWQGVHGPGFAFQIASASNPGQDPTGQDPTGQNPSGQNPGNQNPGNQNPGGPSSNTPGGQGPSGPTTSGPTTPGGQNPTDPQTPIITNPTDPTTPLDPDPIVTPLPGAAVLWLPGALGLIAAMRKKRKNKA